MVGALTFRNHELRNKSQRLNLLSDPASMRTGTFAPPVPGIFTGDERGGRPEEQIGTGVPS